MERIFCYSFKTRTLALIVKRKCITSLWIRLILIQPSHSSNCHCASFPTRVRILKLLCDPLRHDLLHISELISTYLQPTTAYTLTSGMDKSALYHASCALNCESSKFCPNSPT